MFYPFGHQLKHLADSDISDKGSSTWGFLKGPLTSFEAILITFKIPRKILTLPDKRRKISLLVSIVCASSNTLLSFSFTAHKQRVLSHYLSGLSLLPFQQGTFFFCTLD